MFVFRNLSRHAVIPPWWNPARCGRWEVTASVASTIKSCLAVDCGALPFMAIKFRTVGGNVPAAATVFMPTTPRRTVTATAAAASAFSPITRRTVTAQQQRYGLTPTPRRTVTAPAAAAGFRLHRAELLRLQQQRPGLYASPRRTVTATASSGSGLFAPPRRTVTAPAMVGGGIDAQHRRKLLWLQHHGLRTLVPIPPQGCYGSSYSSTAISTTTAENCHGQEHAHGTAD